MKLGAKQRLFFKLITKHRMWLLNEGYMCADGDAMRDWRVHGKPGVKKGYSRAWSCHKWKLAEDIHLFMWNEAKKKWVYQTTTEAHRESGLKWEARHDLCAWGGWFNDGNHYSFKHQVRR